MDGCIYFHKSPKRKKSDFLVLISASVAIQCATNGAGLICGGRVIDVGYISGSVHCPQIACAFKSGTAKVNQVCNLLMIWRKSGLMSWTVNQVCIY